MFDDGEKERFVHNITNKMMAIKNKDVEERVYEYWGKVDADLETRVRESLAKKRAAQNN